MPDRAALPSPSDGVTPRRHERAVAWAVGVAAAAVALGPGLRAGSWLNVDLVVTPVVPVPRGVWGLGPELPRRIPWALPLAWASSVVDGTWVTKAAVVVAIAAAVAGAWLLARRWWPEVSSVAAAGGGLLYGLSPFLLTRLGVGHLPLVFAMGVLPWALPALLDPCRRPWRAFRWALALACCGYFGGTLAIPVVLIGILGTARDDRRIAVPLGLLVGSQLPWIVPGAVVLAQGAAPGAASDFATSGSGSGGVLRVLSGHGFWRDPSQVGADQGWLVPLLGVALVALAVVGLRAVAVPRPIRVWAVAAVGLAVPLASALPGVRAVYAAVAGAPATSVLREGQRLLPLFLVVLAPAVAAGATRLARPRPGWLEGVVLAVPGAVAVLLAGPGLWGVGGALDPVAIPASWAEARSQVVGAPGTVVALPFHAYFPQSVADGRVVLDPMPVYLGGDVITSSDPELTGETRERADPREAHVARVVTDLRRGRPVSARLAALGVRWVVLQHDRDWLDLRGLRADPGLRRVVAGADLELFEVRDWRGPVLGADGTPGPAGQPVAPLARVGEGGAATWFRPAAGGWARGTSGAGRSSGGAVALPAGGAWVWYRPTLMVLLGDGVALLLFFLSIPHDRRPSGDS